MLKFYYNNMESGAMKKIIVFGASGDTGKYCIDYLKNNISNKKYQIIATGARETEYFKEIGIDYYKVDITKEEEFKILPQDEIYAVIDLAGVMPARMKGYNPYKYIDVNIIGNLNILEYCRKCKVDRILFAQSFGDIKDNAEKDILLKVDSPVNFNYSTDHTIYVMTKNFAVDMIKNYNKTYGLKAFVFRLPTIYLWSSIDSFYVDGEIRKIGYRILIDNAINGKDIEVWGDPSRVKDMVYVKDFCQMLYKALFVDREFGHYNVGTGIGTSLLDQINGIIEVFSNDEKKSKIIFKPEKSNAPQYIMDIEPARNELGYVPKYNYIDMLKDIKEEMKLKRF